MLRQHQIDMKNLEKGDIFKTVNEEATTGDEGYYLALKDAQPCEPEGNAVVECVPVSFVKTLPRSDVKFHPTVLGQVETDNVDSLS